MNIVTAAEHRLLTLCILPLAVVILAGLPGRTQAQTTFVVNSEADLPDATLDGVCETINSSECTLRAAIEEANSDPAEDTIEFNITGCSGGICTIQPDSALPDITQTVILDGESQPGATCGASFVGRDLRVVLDGANAGAATGLTLENGSDGSVIKGLVIHSFGNTGILIRLSDSNHVTCSHIGVDATGLLDLGNDGGVTVNTADFNVIGTDGDGLNDASEGNVISGNTNHGIFVAASSNNTTIAGNHIGVNISATSSIGNGSNGIVANDGPSIIGTNGDGVSDALEANVIGGNGSNGITVNRVGSSGTKIAGDFIGTDPSETLNLGNTGAGVFADGALTSAWIGADLDGMSEEAEGNAIAFNGGDGVFVRARGVSVLRNRIFSNQQLGIDLNPNGVTANDSSDVDTGHNNLQNFPELISANLGSLTMIYSVDSDTAHSDFPLRIEFFKADADGQEGQEFLGFDMYTIADWSGCGTAPCADTVTFAGSGLVASDSLVATATDSLGNTSEFSSPIGLTFSGVSLSVKAFLEGAYNATNDKMNTDLFDGGVLPLSQPFSGAEFDGTVLDFDSTQTVSAHADSTVDWLLVSLRTGTAPGTEVAGTKHAAVIFEGGTIVSPDDDSLRFAGIDDGSYYLVLRSRNHLDVMSSAAIVVSGGVGSWDFTTAATQAYPGDDASAQKELETGVYGMFAADGSIDGQVTATDFNDWLVATKAVATGYLQADFDQDVQVTASDFNLWLVNTKAVATSKVP